jgi:hypothetical protein
MFEKERLKSLTTIFL